MLRLAESDRSAVAVLLARFGLDLRTVEPETVIPGSYWGDSEAGLRGATLLARLDTPIHSILHEAAHFICMSPERRVGLDRDAGGDEMEENAVCYLQVLLAALIRGFGYQGAWRDMDAWGYSFRLGSTREWFASDANDSRVWLVKQGLLDTDGLITWQRRE